MVAYVVAKIHVTDPVTYKKYADRAPEFVERHGGRYLTRGGAVITAEGEQFSGRMVILEFPDRSRAEAWLKDPGYVEVSAFRQAASVGQFLIQEGEAPHKP
ncbi:DUF1330 domain-containing protein [Castellaniella sp.]|uniref:DUF1330 domain-containing protein n=1 Tax=Castellaniella sp. TaxID=1955812 RepID=UPI0035696C9F